MSDYGASRDLAGHLPRLTDSGCRDLQLALDSQSPCRDGGINPGGLPCCTGSRIPRWGLGHAGRDRLDGRANVERLFGLLSHEGRSKHRVVHCRRCDWGGD